ncbi:hypothetical protein BSBH6_02236 [Bacillus subtilis]|nr:hypothetical protein BSBH6_02236 [Bacillus subtilis]RPK25042.1 hypothetical protein BH5_01873 [Bacillus subtilis]
MYFGNLLQKKGERSLHTAEKKPEQYGSGFGAVVLFFVLVR